jgi:pyrroloquinoline quinone (PQQ) biosynthesis protein C
VAAGINFAVEGLFHTLYPRMARAFERHYGIPRDQLFFFDDHETADAEHLEDGEYILAHYALTPEQEKRAAHVARRALAFRQRAIEACFTPTRGPPKRHNLHISQVLALTRH